MELRTDQVKLALSEADVVVLLCDVQTGVTDLDQEVARELRKGDIHSLVVVNKVDTEQWETDWHEFHLLGLGEPIPVSAMTGRSVGDMLDRIVDVLPDEEPEDSEIDSVKVAILGRPNVGKSSLVNSLVGAEKVVVDNVPGTTRDSTDTSLEFRGNQYTLIDTAGLRRAKALRKTQDSIEYYSTLRTINAIERCDVAVVIIDATEHLVKQDLEVIDQVHEQGKALVIVANKWDMSLRRIPTRQSVYSGTLASISRWVVFSSGIDQRADGTTYVAGAGRGSACIRELDEEASNSRAQYVAERSHAQQATARVKEGHAAVELHNTGFDQAAYLPLFCKQSSRDI